MSVFDGTPVDAATTNPAFLKPDVDDYSVSRLGGRRGAGNAAVPSGSYVADYQRFVNNLGDTLGLDVSTDFSGEADATGTTYGSNSTVIGDGDSHKLAIRLLSNTMASTIGTGGHGHTGNGADGPPLSLVSAITGVLQEMNGGTGKSSWTPGSIVYAGSITLAEDNANFFWDATNKRIGLKTNTPRTTLDVQGDIAFIVDTDASAGNIPALDSTDNVVIQLSGSPHVQGISNGLKGKTVILLDTSGSGFIVENDSGSAAAGDRIYAAITGNPWGAVPFVYSEDTGHWHPAGGGSGGGGGFTPIAPTYQEFTGGMSGTYVSPAGVLRIRVTVRGAGGGGGDSILVGNGSGGSNTTFAAPANTGFGGGGGQVGPSTAGPGGTAQVLTGIQIEAFSGGSGDPGSSVLLSAGGSGGVNNSGGSGPGGTSNQPGLSGINGTGAGGGGSGGTATNASAGGGGAGGYCIFDLPPGSYAYSVGLGGAGFANSGNGGDGFILVEEFYQ